MDVRLSLPILGAMLAATNRVILTTAVLALLGLGRTGAGAQNLLTNPGFEGDLSGWTLHRPVEFEPDLDATGTPGSGSARFGSNATGNPVIVLSQCLPAVAGASYSFGVKVYLPTQSLASPTGVWLAFTSKTDCTGDLLHEEGPLYAPLGPQTWALVDSAPVVAPAGAESMWLLGVRAHINPDEGATSIWDDFYLVEESGEPVPTAEALEVDGTPIASDGNRVFEPGEQVEMAPVWRNNDSASLSLMGAASGFTGPAGATYTVVGGAADYGVLDPGAAASCRDTDLCFALEVDDSAVRPALHWDTTVLETLTDPGATLKTWTLHLGDSFGDVSRTHVFYRFVETMLHHGMAVDCGGGNFCPDIPESREMVARAVLRGFEGIGYTPPPCVSGQEVFADVPFDSPFCPWIEELFERGVVAGCGGGNFCPAAPVTRAQIAIFLLKTLEGVGYMPPACAGIFADVACPSLFADWIEELFNRGITAGCATSPLRYCPGGLITRGQCAVLQSKNFDLPLYEP